MLAPLPVEGQEKEGRDREREDSQQPQIEGREENKEKSIRTNLARLRRGWRRTDEEALVCVSSADAKHETVQHPTRSPNELSVALPCTASRALTGLILWILFKLGHCN